MKEKRKEGKRCSILHPSPNIMRHLARIGDRRGAYRILGGRLEGKRQFGRLSVDGRIILK
jgi:hypothetical protein